MNIQGQIFT